MCSSDYISLCFSVLVNLQNGQFHASYLKPTGWTHILINYIRFNGGAAIIIHDNNRQVTSDTTKTVKSYSPGDGRIVVGRQYTDKDSNYVSVQVDELIFFNEALTDKDVEALFEL